jgi:hypothetical protein
MQIELIKTTSQFDIAHLSIDYKTIEKNDFNWKLQIDSIDKAQEELKNPKALKEFNDALSKFLLYLHKNNRIFRCFRLCFISY